MRRRCGRSTRCLPLRENPIAFEQWIPIVTDFGIQPSWAPDGHGVYHFSFRDGAFCAGASGWISRRCDRSARLVRAVQHLHEPRLRAVTGAGLTDDVRGGYLYVTLTETTGNIWMMQNDSEQRSATR